MDGRRDDREVIPKCRPASQATQKKRYGVNVDETTQNHRINTAIKHKNIQPSTMSKTHTAWQAVDGPSNKAKL